MIIGLTGGIATGKSTVAKMFEEQGAFIIDADIVARQVVEPGGSGLAALVEEFGEEVLIPETGELNRAELGRAVFEAKEVLEKLNEILQPRIREEIMNQLEEAKKNHSFIVVDMPLLFEEKYEDEFDEIVVVSIPKDLQLERLQKRNGFPEDEAMRRINSQLHMSYKEKHADVVIDNSKDLEFTREQVKNWIESIEK